MKIRRTRRAVGIIELTPLVDVVFLLLTFYMLTSTFVRREAVPMNLPESSSSESISGDTLSISLISEALVTVDEDEMRVEDLQDYLTGRVSPTTAIIVRSDRSLGVQSLIEVLDEVRKAGGSKVSIATVGK